MNALHALYDALLAINVPLDKAKAVVEAAEQDVISTLATKSDLQALHSELLGRMALLESNLENKLTALENKLENKIATQGALFQKDLQLLESRMTTRLGSLLVVAMGVLFAALKLT